MKKVELTQANRLLAKYARELDNETVVLTLDRKPVAAFVPLDDADWETVALGTNPKFLRLIEQSRESLRRKGGLSSDDIRRRFGMKPRKARR